VGATTARLCIGLPHAGFAGGGANGAGAAVAAAAVVAPTEPLAGLPLVFFGEPFVVDGATEAGAWAWTCFVFPPANAAQLLAPVDADADACCKMLWPPVTFGCLLLLLGAELFLLLLLLEDMFCASAL
jgi:hypothetical protein